MDHLAKTRLEAYVMKRTNSLPVYAIKQEGLDHIPKFHCAITVLGRRFKTLTSYPTQKAAKQAAARLALESLNIRDDEVPGVAYKNMLQEIAQRKLNTFPAYNTIAFGPPHDPSFVSTVKYGQKTFSGKVSKTKKMAEMSAAKEALNRIKHGTGESESTSDTREYESDSETGEYESKCKVAGI